MYTAQTLRNRYADNALQTASGPRVIVMAYDRLDRDLAEAIAALATRDLDRVHAALVHAQDLVDELLLMLDPERWEHAGTLAGIYEFVRRQLFTANITKDGAIIEDARRLLAGLGDAFRTAAASLATVPPAGPDNQDRSGQHWSLQA